MTETSPSPLVGRRYASEPVFAHPDTIEAYARAIGAEGSWPRSDGAAPPLYSVRPLHALALKTLEDEALDLDVARLVHGTQDLRFLRPLRAWDVLTVRGEILGVDVKATGRLVRVAQRVWVEGQLAVEVEAGYFERSAVPPVRTPGPRAPAAEPAPRTEVHVSTFSLARSELAAYAEASLDRNPIHLDESFARAAGLPGVIAHGLLTQAVAGRRITEALAGGDPLALRRYAVRFERPVLPDTPLRLCVWRSSGLPDGALGVEVGNPDGRSALTGTVWLADEPAG